MKLVEIDDFVHFIEKFVARDGDVYLTDVFFFSDSPPKMETVKGGLSSIPVAVVSFEMGHTILRYLFCLVFVCSKHINKSRH